MKRACGISVAMCTADTPGATVLPAASVTAAANPVLHGQGYHNRQSTGGCMQVSRNLPTQGGQAVHLIRLRCVTLGVQSSAAGQWGRKVCASEARWTAMHMGGRHRTWRNADAQGSRPRVGLCPGQVARRGSVQDIPHLHMYQAKTPCADCTFLCMCLCNPQAAHGSTHAATARYFERSRVRHNLVHPREKCTTRGLLICERSWNQWGPVDTKLQRLQLL